eukprot:7357612-Pyramimonas_sp.AAC.1
MAQLSELGSVRVSEGISQSKGKAACATSGARWTPVRQNVHGCVMRAACACTILALGFHDIPIPC